MSGSPVLAYKKPSREAKSQRGTPKPSPQPLNTHKFGSSESTLTPPTPSTPIETSRKVLSRRKALQDFYRIQQSKNGGQGEETANLNEAEPAKESSEKESTEEALEDKSYVDILNDPEKFKKFLTESKSVELLQARNGAAGKLNLHDSERKAIIYDNYYELIKLNQVLSNLSGDKKQDKTIDDDLDAKDKQTKDVTDEHVIKVLGEVSEFFSSTAATFNDDFASVVGRLSTRRADSAASVQGIVEGPGGS